jgi:competence protein ComGC
MKTNRSLKNSKAAFSFTELCTVVACGAILVMLVFPALAANKIQSASTGCLYNLRHLQTGCAMYSTENNDYLMPNASVGSVDKNTWCGGEAEGLFSSANANTNPAPYMNSLLWPYVGKLSVYRCPGDTVPSPNGLRIRSYSMNSQMGNGPDFDTGYFHYAKQSDIIRPTPANVFVFADESPDSIDDGYLQISSGTPEFPSIPACYLEGGCGFSFADGHGEIHRWQTSSLLIPINRILVNVPATGGVRNADWIWFTQHATAHQ